LSWQLFRRKRDTAAILLLCLAGLALRLFTASDMYVHDWDERYHALVAKNMISHPLVPTLYDDPVLPYDYKDWTANHVWLHKQPLPLWGMAASMAIFGVNEIAARLPSILLTTLGIWLIFVIGKYFFDRKTGFLAAFFFAINGLILELAAGRMPTDHIDIFFLFFVELAVFFTILFLRKQNTIFNILAGISIGLAILSKWLPALIVLPVWLLLVYDSGKFSIKAMAGQFILLITVTTAVFLPWQIYIYRAFPQEASWESSMNFRHLTHVIEDQTGPFYYYLNKIRINYGELIYLPLIWLIYRIGQNPGKLKLWALAVWFFIPFIFFSVVTTKMQGYLLFTAPVLFILTAAFFWKLDEWKKRFRYPLLVNILLIIFLALPVRYAIERSKPFSSRDRNPEWVRELKAQFKVQSASWRTKFKVMEGSVTGEPRTANCELRTSSTILFNYPRPVEAMFYMGMTVYKTVPDTSTIKQLQGRGYEIMIHDDGKLAEDIKGLEGVVYRKFLVTGD
jgi:4-amino-4-deoxy-L-arabinose transferase